MPVRTATKMRQETMTAVSAIHGASKKNLKPAYDGMFDTLQKRCKMKDLTNYVLGNENLTKTVVSEHYKKELKDFEKSKKMRKGVLPHFTPVVSWARENIKVLGLCFQ
jgi:hypothetical protein